MSSNDEFFEDVQAAGAHKHGVIRRYPPVFASKAGFATRGRVSFVDGYAGAGQYASGAPGSPMLLDRAAAQIEALTRRDIECIFVEQDQRHLQRLTSLEFDGANQPVILDGRFEDHVDQVLQRSRGRALLVFLDPFGTAIGYKTVTNQILGRSGRAPSEVLLHFSVASVRRKASAAVSGKNSGRNRALLKAQLDEFLGGDWWEELARAAADDEVVSATEAALEIATEYSRRVCASSKCKALALDIRAQPDHQPLYRLILFTRSEHGLWHYADAAGSAYVDWLVRCRGDEMDRQHLKRKAKAEAKRALLYDQGVRSLFDDLVEPEPEAPLEIDRRDVDASIGEIYRPVIEMNLRDMLASSSEVHLGWSTAAVYGESLGIAREMHVRAAGKELVKAGVIHPPLEGWNKMAKLTLRRR